MRRYTRLCGLFREWVTSFNLIESAAVAKAGQSAISSSRRSSISVKRVPIQSQNHPEETVSVKETILTQKRRPVSRGFCHSSFYRTPVKADCGPSRQSQGGPASRFVRGRRKSTCHAERSQDNRGWTGTAAHRRGQDFRSTVSAHRLKGHRCLVEEPSEMKIVEIIGSPRGMNGNT